MQTLTLKNVKSDAAKTEKGIQRLICKKRERFSLIYFFSEDFFSCLNSSFFFLFFESYLNSPLTILFLIFFKIAGCGYCVAAEPISTF